jgi:rubrerythrin
MRIASDSGETLEAKAESSRTVANLRAALWRASCVSARYHLWAQIADAEGRSAIAATLRGIAEAEESHARGHLERLVALGAQGASGPTSATIANLRAAIEAETYEHSSRYPGFARTAREEGLTEIADWFETVAKSGHSHAQRLAHALQALPLLPD